MNDQTATIDIRSINEKIERESAFVDLLTIEMNKVIVGQKHMIERLLIGLLGQGHILLEGVPGVKGPICQSRAITRHCARIAGIDGETGRGSTLAPSSVCAFNP